MIDIIDFVLVKNLVFLSVLPDETLTMNLMKKYSSLKPIFTGDTNEYQRAEMGRSLEAIERSRAEEKEQATLFKPGNKVKQSLESNVQKRLPSREGTRSVPRLYGSSFEIAKRIGISHATYERSKRIIEKATEEQKNLLRKGDVGSFYRLIFPSELI